MSEFCLALSKYVGFKIEHIIDCTCTNQGSEETGQAQAKLLFPL